MISFYHLQEYERGKLSSELWFYLDRRSQEEAGRADDKTADPHQCHCASSAEFRDEHGVVEWLDDGDVAVDRNRDQVVDRRRAHPDVHRQPDRAPSLTEDPILIEHFVRY